LRVEGTLLVTTPRSRRTPYGGWELKLESRRVEFRARHLEGRAVALRASEWPGAPDTDLMRALAHMSDDPVDIVTGALLVALGETPAASAQLSADDRHFLKHMKATRDAEFQEGGHHARFTVMLTALLACEVRPRWASRIVARRIGWETLFRCIGRRLLATQYPVYCLYAFAHWEGMSDGIACAFVESGLVAKGPWRPGDTDRAQAQATGALNGFAFPLGETLARIQYLPSITGRSVLAGLRKLNLTEARWPLDDGLNPSVRALRDAVMEVRGRAPDHVSRAARRRLSRTFRRLVLTWETRTLRWRRRGYWDVYIPAHPILMSKLSLAVTGRETDPKADPLRTVLLTRAQVETDPMIALATIKAIRACIRDHASTIRTKVTPINEAYREWDDAYGEWLKISGQASEALQVQ